MRPICSNGIITHLRDYQQQANRELQRRIPIEQIIGRMTRGIPYPDGPRKVLKVRERNVDFTLGKIGTLKPVMGKRFYKHHYTHIQLRGKIHSVTVSNGIFDAKIVWIN